MTKRFGYNWFEVSAKSNFNKYLSKFKGRDGLRFLEIGPFQGNATCYMLDNILTGSDCTITCIDTFLGSLEHKELEVNCDNLFNIFSSNISEWKDKVIMLIGKSQEELRRDHLRYPIYDFIYIDGSHTSPDVLEDAILSFRLLKADGIMAFDDYLWKMPESINSITNELDSPGHGIDCFLNIFKGQYNLLLKDYQVWIEKIEKS